MNSLSKPSQALTHVAFFPALKVGKQITAGSTGSWPALQLFGLMFLEQVFGKPVSEAFISSARKVINLHMCESAHTGMYVCMYVNEHSASPT